MQVRLKSCSDSASLAADRCLGLMQGGGGARTL